MPHHKVKPIHILATRTPVSQAIRQSARWVALRLLEGDRKIEEEVRSGQLGNLMAGSLSTEEEISRKVIR